MRTACKKDHFKPSFSRQKRLPGVAQRSGAKSGAKRLNFSSNQNASAWNQARPKVFTLKALSVSAPTQPRNPRNILRMNWADESVIALNGLNLTGWLKMYKNKKAVVNGISIGGIPTARSMQPINIGLLGVGSAPGNCNGLTLGAGVIGSAGNVNGLSVSGLYTGVDGTDSSISGVSISAGAINAHKTMDGLALGGLAVVCDKDIHGVAASLLYLSCDDALRGVGVCPGYVQCEVYKGVSIAGYATTTKMHGVAVGLYNRAQELHGVQFGLMNYAGNNPKGFRRLPFINLHFGKKPISEN